MSVLELIYLFLGVTLWLFYIYIYIYSYGKWPIYRWIMIHEALPFQNGDVPVRKPKNNQRVLSKFMCYMLYTIYILFYIYIYASYVSCRWVTRWLPTKLVRPSSSVTKSLAPRCAASWRESAQNPRSSPWKKGGGPIHGGSPGYGSKLGTPIIGWFILN